MCSAETSIRQCVTRKSQPRGRDQKPRRHAGRIECISCCTTRQFQLQAGPGYGDVVSGRTVMGCSLLYLLPLLAPRHSATNSHLICDWRCPSRLAIVRCSLESLKDAQSSTETSASGAPQKMFPIIGIICFRKLVNSRKIIRD